MHSFMVLLICQRWRCCATMCVVMTNCRFFSFEFPNLVHKPADPWQCEAAIEPRDCSWAFKLRLELTEELTICQWADTLQPSWQSAICWASTLQPSCPNAAELTLCGWKMTAELTWPLSVPVQDLYRKYDGGTMTVMTCHVRWKDT